MNKKKQIKTRTFIQIFFFILVAIIAVNKTLVESGGGISFISAASLHAICPFGGVVTIYQYLTAGTFVKKIHESSFVLMVIMFILAVGFGPIFCGWICPFGSFQEWIGKLGKKIFKNKYNRIIPSKIDSYLRYLRYLVLIWVLYMTAISGQIIFQNIDPYYSLFNFWTGEIAITGFIVLGVSIILSIFVERPWCKYVCPYGAVLGITNSFRIFKIRRNKAKCINCKVCDQVCPMNIEVSESIVIRNHQCISCLKCTSEQSCPIDDTVIVSIKGGNENETK